MAVPDDIPEDDEFAFEDDEFAELEESDEADVFEAEAFDDDAFEEDGADDDEEGFDVDDAFEEDGDVFADEEADAEALEEDDLGEPEPELAPSAVARAGTAKAAAAQWPHGAKRNLFLTSLVGAFPAAFLTFLMVKVFLNYAGKTTGLLMGLAGVTLAASAVVALTPIGIVLFSPKEMKAAPKKSKRTKKDAAAAKGDAATAEPEGFDDVIPDDFTSDKPAPAEAADIDDDFDDFGDEEDSETEAELEDIGGGDDDEEFAFDDDMFAEDDDGELEELDFDIEDEKE